MALALSRAGHGHPEVLLSTDDCRSKRDLTRGGGNQVSLGFRFLESAGAALYQSFSFIEQFANPATAEISGPEIHRKIFPILPLLSPIR
jgi:hypothetical protein